MKSLLLRTIPKLNKVDNIIDTLEKSKTKFNILFTIATHNYIIYGNSDYISTSVEYYTKKDCLIKKENCLARLNILRDNYLNIIQREKKVIK